MRASSSAQGLHRVFLRQRAAGGGLVTHGLNLLRAIQRTLRGINLCCPSGVTHRILILKRVSLISHDAISAARFSNSTNNTHQQNRQNPGPNHPQTSMKPNIVTGRPVTSVGFYHSADRPDVHQELSSRSYPKIRNSTVFGRMTLNIGSRLRNRVRVYCVAMARIVHSPT